MSKQGSGFLYVIAAPSGAGKTSLVASLLKSMDNLKVSISYTTRSLRPAEEDEVDYHFVDDAEFQKMIDEHAFLEYAKVYDYYYGTSREWVLKQLSRGTDIILEIDWQGARQIKEKFPEAILIFILPPSLQVLRERLERRKQDTPAVINKRMKTAQQEISHYAEYDYLVVNDDFGVALGELKRIITVQRLRCTVQEKRLAKLLADLLEKQ